MNQNINNDFKSIKKQEEQNTNYFYGVNVNDKEAVQKEFERLQKQHRKITILVVIVLLCLGILLLDFVRVNFMDRKPILAISKKVDGGTLFSGIGYEVLYCENGEKFTGAAIYEKCDDFNDKNFNTFIYDKFMDFASSKKILVKNELREFKINTITFDAYNVEGGSDYLLNISFVCNDNTSICFKTKKEYSNYNNVNLYVSLNKYNEIYDLIYFKNSGNYYDILVNKLSESIKKYLKNNNKIIEDNLRHFNIKLIENNGKYKFRDVSYYDSYLIEINYSCNDNTNSCLVPFDNEDLENDYANLVFYSAVFINESNEVLLMGPKEYFD